ncbi:MAG: Fic family protein [Thermoleophilaceae bacterium]
MTGVYRTPQLEPVEREVLRLIEGLRQELEDYVHTQPRRWLGNMRRVAFARAVQASNSIEGYDASLDDVVAAVDDEPTLSTNEETRLALAGYRDAMTYILQVARDADVAVDAGLLKSLHFMMLKHDLSKNPGRWRPGSIYVRRESTGQVVYEGPENDQVPSLVAASIEELEGSDAPVLVRAAMAHLNLVMVHPFSDGNGRMARALQTLVLARQQIMAPVFSSIEEYLGRNTQTYYDLLGDVGDGQWNPQRNARPWIRFCLTAHYHQARTQLRRVRETERLFAACHELVERHGFPERTVAPLVEAAFGFRLRNASYREIIHMSEGEEVSNLTASRDLRAMVDAKLLRPQGEKRGRYYLGERVLRARHEAIRADREPKETADPFDLASGQLELGVD